MRSRVLGLTAMTAVALAAAAPARAQDAETLLMANLRLTTEPSVAQNCARIGFVSDDSLKDLRRKVVRAGGDTAVLTFRTDDLSRIQAEMFRCKADPAPRAPGAPGAPGAIPPLPPPPPPPPPPPVTR